MLEVTRTAPEMKDVSSADQTQLSKEPASWKTHSSKVARQTEMQRGKKRMKQNTQEVGEHIKLWGTCNGNIKREERKKQNKYLK